MSEQIELLKKQIKRLNDAPLFQRGEFAVYVLESNLAVLLDQERRLQQLEKPDLNPISEGRADDGA